jgi:hypothetical protein
MRILSVCSKEEVYRHWEQVDRFKNCPHVAVWRKRIWSPLPADIRWYNAEIEDEDLKRIFIISSDEWCCLSRTFKLMDVAGEVAKRADNEIVCRIHDLIGRFKENPESLDRKLTMVSPSFEGNFTVIDGNKRAVVLHSIGELAGNRIYLGISEKIVDYRWAERAMSDPNTAKNLYDAAHTN